MSNIQRIYQEECNEAYMRDGAQEANADLRRTAGQREELADAMSRTVTTVANGTAAATVLSTAAIRLYKVMIQAAGSGGFLVLYNLTAATVGVSAINMVLPFTANETVTYRMHPGNSPTPWDTGCCAGTVTAVATSTAITTAVTAVHFLFA